MKKPLFDGAGVYSQSHWRSLIHRCNAVCGICTAVSIATDVTAMFIVMRKKGATYIKKALFYGYFSIVSPLFLLPRLSCHEGIFSDTACLGVKVLSPDMFATINKGARSFETRQGFFGLDIPGTIFSVGERSDNLSDRHITLVELRSRFGGKLLRI